MIPNDASTFLTQGLTIFINGPANLPKKAPINLPDFIFVDILLAKAILILDFCLVVRNKSFGNSLDQKFFLVILGVVPVLFLTAVVSLFI